MEGLFDHPIGYGISIGVEQARPQEWLRIVDVVFLGLSRIMLVKNNLEDNIQPHLFIELSDVDGNLVGLLVSLQLIEADLVFDNLAEQERQQLFVIFCLREILSEALHCVIRLGM